MLQIRDIHKQYKTGELVQTALDGVSLNLRRNEFVAILGPSGSGKTTLLNVIGGLDRYDSGDLIINGISTKKYSDRDWDSYRNHSIGFVFQSYNLIPHQSVLANVELALTISGISRSERKKRAKAALEAVGLGNQLHKRPNQMSGGQMQRVAIARALVNDPDILLADEPTGALDSETSVQVMDLLKEVSSDRLVVMVTHNPELAEAYANRIVRVKDGRIVSDSNPYEDQESLLAAPVHKNMGKASMSFATALSLSFNNLRTKLARTLLTSFAGSIGIIGIALIMALSTGFQKYIDKIQEDTLSNYPLTLQAETADMGAAMAAFGASMLEAENLPEGMVGEQQMISAMFSQIGKNDLAGFKVHLEENYDTIGHTINTIKYGYGVRPLIFASDTEDILQVNPATLFSKVTGNSAMSAYMDSNVFYELLDNTDLLEDQYEVVQGRWPEGYSEMVFVLTDPNQITDYMAYALGMKPADELETMLNSIMQGQQAENPGQPEQWTYEDLLNLRFKLVDASSLYRYNEEYGVWENMSGDSRFMANLIEAGEELSIVGIVCPKEGVNATTLTAGIAYTSDLTWHVISQAENSKIVQSQLADTSIDVFTGKAFGVAEEEENQLNFEDMITVDEEILNSSFGMNISTGVIVSLLENYLNSVAGSLAADTGPAQQAFLTVLSNMGREMLRGCVAEYGDPAKIYLSDGEKIVDAYLAGPSATAQIEALAVNYSMTAEEFRETYRTLLLGMITSCVNAELSGEGIDLVAQPQSVNGNSAASGNWEDYLPEWPTRPQPTETPTEAPTESPTEAPTEATTPETEAPTEVTEPETHPTEPTQPETETPTEPDGLYAMIWSDSIDSIVDTYLTNPIVTGTAGITAAGMVKTNIMQNLMGQLSGFANVLTGYIGNAFYVDTEALASAFTFDMDEEELQRLMEAMSSQGKESSASANLKTLGYADLAEPTSISIYMVDFAAKEAFIDFLDTYNADREAAGEEESVIRYTDVTGIMMSSVRTIIDSVSYALIAFVAVSLVVSSIMIGIITYISVMERTKEIGVLRAIGASKRNISQVFNAETFIIGLCSGLIGIGMTLLVLIPGNQLIQHLTNNPDIVAQLPMQNGLALIGLSMILTLIGGFIPARQAAKKDPVIALRTE